MLVYRLLAVLTLTAVSILAAPNVTRASNGTDHYGPFPSVSQDGSSCGMPWATDTFNRYFDVRDNGDGTFTVTEKVKDGTFVTNGTTSPGACETTSHHGMTVLPGITGRFDGYYTFTVASTTYNPNGCTTNPCNTLDGFIAAVFGSSAYANYPLSFNFEYSSSDQSLEYHAWQDRGNETTATNYFETFVGDIAND